MAACECDIIPASGRKDRELWKLKVSNTVAQLARAHRTLQSKPQKPDPRFPIFSTGGHCCYVTSKIISSGEQTKSVRVQYSGIARAPVLYFVPRAELPDSIVAEYRTLESEWALDALSQPSDQEVDIRSDGDQTSATHLGAKHEYHTRAGHSKSTPWLLREPGVPERPISGPRNRPTLGEMLYNSR